MSAPAPPCWPQSSLTQTWVRAASQENLLLTLSAFFHSSITSRSKLKSPCLLDTCLREFFVANVVNVYLYKAGWQALKQSQVCIPDIKLQHNDITIPHWCMLHLYLSSEWLRISSITIFYYTDQKHEALMSNVSFQLVLTQSSKISAESVKKNVFSYFICFALIGKNNRI